MNDAYLETKIEELKSTIYSWAQQYDALWNDCTFTSWMKFFDDEPTENPYVLLLCPSQRLSDIWYGGYDPNNLLDELYEIVGASGYEMDDCGCGVIGFSVQDDLEELRKAYRNYFEWQWICSLVQPDFSDLYEEVYTWFHKNPDFLYNLDPRQFEILLDGVFRNNGYKTQLGAGQNDGGVDIRLYSNEVIGEALTLVQAKRYKDSNPIQLQALQALSAVVEDERANQGLFITTSRYLPCAQKFAARQNTRLKLATSNDVSLWSSYAAERIISDKSLLIKPDHVKFLLNSRSSSDTLEGKIFHASTGYTMVLNEFAMILRESKGAALLIKLPSIKVSGDVFQGYEIPNTDSVALERLDAEDVFRAKKKYRENGELYLWRDQKLYSLWNSEPKYYDRLD